MLQKMLNQGSRFPNYTVRQLQYNKDRVRDALRKHGVEGEDAIYLFCYQYLIYSSNTAQFPKNILERGRKALERIKEDKDVVDTLKSVISLDPTAEHLSSWYEYFIGRRFREGSGKFFTPHPIAKAMAALIPRKENAVIMDPTCGGGTFLVEASRGWADLHCVLVANDIEISLIDLTKVVLDLGTPRRHRKSFSNSNIYEPDSEFTHWYGKIDYILANPPFSLSIDSVTNDSKLFSLGYKTSDAIFLDTCSNLLKPCGRLVTLLPHSIVANTDFLKLRLEVEESWNLLGVICLPEGVFHLAANTTTRADIVILERRCCKNNKISKTIFASAPAVGMPLSSREGEQENYLNAIISNPAAVSLLGIDKP
jgi:type I restriction-modification system DNA methylase subunit